MITNRKVLSSSFPCDVFFLIIQFKPIHSFDLDTVHPVAEGMGKDGNVSPSKRQYLPFQILITDQCNLLHCSGDAR